jgi:hypothetical protein
MLLLLLASLCWFVRQRSVLSFNQVVVGSIPTGLTIVINDLGISKRRMLSLGKHRGSGK